MLFKNKLKKNGFETKVFQQLTTRDNDFLETIIAYAPEIIAFTAVSSMYSKTKKFCQEIKNRLPEVISIIGGVHASMSPEDCVKDFDFIFRGEGEKTLSVFLERLNTGQKPTMPGIYFIDKQNHETFDGGYSPRIDDLDELGIPDRSDLNMSKYNGAVPQPKISGNFASIVASRGCPHACIFCTNEQFWRKKPRVRSVQSVMQEIQLLKAIYNAQYVWFQDAEITMHKQFLKDLCGEIIKEKLNLYFYTMARVTDMLDLELLDLMKRSGFIQICMGVESGSQKILNESNKKIERSQIIQAFDNVYNEGIFPTALFIMGWPNETKATLNESIALAKQIKALRIRYANLYPFVGTKIRYIINKNNLWLDEKYKDPSFATTEEQVLKCEVPLAELSNDKVVKNIYDSPEYKKRMVNFIKIENDQSIKTSLLKYQKNIARNRV